MPTAVTMLQTRRGEDGNPWNAGSTYQASDAFATFLINSNLATGTLPVPVDPGFAPAAQNAAKSSVARFTVGDLFTLYPGQVCVAHRAAGAYRGPEGTREAYQLARTYPIYYIIDGGDWYDSADGGIFDYHNGTDLSQLTNLTGAISGQTSTALRRCTVNVSTWFGNGSANQTGLLGIDDFLSLVRGRCISPEPKTTKAAQILARELSIAGYQQRALVNSFTDSHFQYFVAEGFPFLARNVASGAEHATLADPTTGPARCRTLQGLGVFYVILDEFDANFAAAAAVCNANGMRVGCYTGDTTAGTNGKAGALARQYHKTLIDAAASMAFYVADDPLYFMGDTANYRRTSDSWALKAGLGVGHINRYNTRPPTTSTKRGTVTAGGRLSLPNEDTNNNWILAGELCPLVNAAGSYTITATINFSALPADLTRWAGLAICCPDDRAYTDTGATTAYVRNDGYQVWVVPSNGTNATLSIARKNAGTGTNLGGTPFALSSTISAGGIITLTIAVTPTTITATVAPVSGTTAAGTTGAISDSTFRGAYFHYGHAAVASGTLTPEWNLAIS